MLNNVPSSGRQAFQDLTDRARLIPWQLEELVKLYQNWVVDISQYCDWWRAALTNRTGELGDPERKVAQQRAEVDRLGRDVALLSNQRMDASLKLDADQEASRRELTSRISKLNERALSLEDQVKDRHTKFSP